MKISRGLSIAGLVVAIIAFVCSVVAISLSGAACTRTSPKRRVK